MTIETLRPGDYVYIGGLDGTKQKLIADAFIATGAEKGSGYPYLQEESNWDWLVWDLEHNCTNRIQGLLVDNRMGIRRLSYTQVCKEEPNQNTTISYLRTARKEREKAEASYQAALEAVRNELGGGFTLTDDGADEPQDDMSDPQNWREGDVVECIKTEWFTIEEFTLGHFYTISRILYGYDGHGFVDIDDDHGDKMGVPADHFRFHHRPQ